MKIFDTRFFYTLDHTAKPVTGPEELITVQGLIFTTENNARSSIMQPELLFKYDRPAS